MRSLRLALGTLAAAAVLGGGAAVSLGGLSLAGHTTAAPASATADPDETASASATATPSSTSSSTAEATPSSEADAHGDAVASAAASCPTGSGDVHGDCVSAVARGTHGAASPDADPATGEPAGAHR